MSYNDSVEMIARTVIESEGVNEQRWHRHINESVDGSSWIMNYGKNEEVLANTTNEPDANEISGMCAENATWKDMRQIAAYMAMERDVHAKCKELVDEYFECDECGVTQKDESRAEDGEDFCKGCSYQCGDCGAAFRKSQAEAQKDGAVRCPSCTEEKE